MAGMKDWFGDLAVGLIGLGIATALVAWNIWLAVPVLILWIVVNERRIKMQGAANPAPPPVPEGAEYDKPQVTKFGNGAGISIKVRSIEHTTGLRPPSQTEENDG